MLGRHFDVAAINHAHTLGAIFCRVSEIKNDQVVYSIKGADGEAYEHSIPTNFVLWSTGIAMNPFTARVSNLLPNQVHKKAIEVDAHLRVKGAPLGDVYAIGDASTVRPLTCMGVQDL